MFKEKSLFAILEVPTGAGKSALALTTALYAAGSHNAGFESGAYGMREIAFEPAERLVGFQDLLALTYHVYRTSIPPLLRSQIIPILQSCWLARRTSCFAQATSPSECSGFRAPLSVTQQR